jgi:hypothetical protein
VHRSGTGRRTLLYQKRSVFTLQEFKEGEITIPCQYGLAAAFVLRKHVNFFLFENMNLNLYTFWHCNLNEEVFFFQNYRYVAVMVAHL